MVNDPRTLHSPVQERIKARIGELEQEIETSRKEFTVLIARRDELKQLLKEVYHEDA